MTTSSRVPARAPLYVRALRLRQLHVGGLASFLLFECMIAVGVLLALAELVSWWAVLILPTAVAIMVKVNDVAAGVAARGRSNRRAAAEARQDVAEEVEAPAGHARHAQKESRKGKAEAAAKSDGYDSWDDDWEAVMGPAGRGEPDSPADEIVEGAAGRSASSGGRPAQRTPLARALQRAQSRADDDTPGPIAPKQAVPSVPAGSDLEAQRKQIGVIRISVPSREGRTGSRAVAQQQRTSRSRKDHEPADDHLAETETEAETDRPVAVRAAAQLTERHGAPQEQSDYADDAHEGPAYEEAGYSHAAYRQEEHADAAYQQVGYAGAGYQAADSHGAEYEADYQGAGYRPVDPWSEDRQPAVYQEGTYRSAAYQGAAYREAYPESGHRETGYEDVDYQDAAYQGSAYQSAAYQDRAYGGTTYRQGSYQASGHSSSDYHAQPVYQESGYLRGEDGDDRNGVYRSATYRDASYNEHYDEPTYSHESGDAPDRYGNEALGDAAFELGGPAYGGYFGANESYHTGDSATGRHARAHHTGGGRYGEEGYATSGGRHSENGRRDDDIARQRGTLNQGRFA